MFSAFVVLIAINAAIFLSTAGQSGDGVVVVSSAKAIERSASIRATKSAGASPAALAERSSPLGFPSKMNRGEILPGEALRTAAVRLGVEPRESAVLTAALGRVFDVNDAHAGDTFVSQTDDAGRILWFELKSLVGTLVGVRREGVALVPYRKESSSERRPFARGELP